MKNKALIALLIILYALTPLKILSNENSINNECLTEIIKKSESFRAKGERYNFVIQKDAKSLSLFKLQVNNQIDLLERAASNISLEQCSFDSAKDLYNFYKDDIKEYINKEPLLVNSDKHEQDNGNIVIFKSISTNINSNNGPPLNEPVVAEPQKEKINIDIRSDELIEATINIKKLFIDNGLNEAPYIEASSELIKMVKNKWEGIKNDACQLNDKKMQLVKCEEKQKIINSFKEKNLPLLKNIQIFKNNKTKIDSCFNKDGFNEKNCSAIKKITSENSSEYLQNLISQKKEKVEYIEQVYNGLIESDFVYEDFELIIDTYVNNVLKPFINNTKLKIEKEQKDKEDKQEEEEKKRKELENQRKLNKFIDLLKIQSKFNPLDINIENILSDSIDLINKKVNTEDLAELKSYEDKILEFSEDIKEKIEYINSQDDIDQIISNIKKLENYKIYKNDSDVKTIIKELKNEKEKRSKFIVDLNSIFSQLINKISSFETEKQLLENSDKIQKTLQTQINKLEGDIFSLEEDLEAQSNYKLFYMWAFFISLISLLGFTAFYIYRFQQNKSSADHTLRSSFNDQYKQIINENKNLKQELEKYKSQLQSREKTTENVKERSFKSRFDDEQTQVIEPKISPLNEMLSFYEGVLRDPNKIDTFINKYQSIALDRQSRIISQGDTILIKDNKGFSKSNFWLVFIDNRYILLPGRTLNVNVSSLIADNYRYARDLLSGIFSYKLGNEFKMLQYAELEKNGDSYKVIAEGSLNLPQT